MPTPRKLVLDDIADLRAYERERDEFRARIIALKKRRRVGVVVGELLPDLPETILDIHALPPAGAA